MNKIVHLRGTNGVGKTTAVSQFIARGDFEKRSENILKKTIEYHEDERRGIIVLGRYGENTCGGIDGRITNRDILLNVIAYFVKRKMPKVLVFEGVLYGVTYKFGKELYDFARQSGYQYIGICLTMPLEEAIDRVIRRSGNTNIDVLSIQNKYFTSLSAYKKLLQDGACVELVDTSKVPYDRMYELIEERL